MRLGSLYEKAVDKTILNRLDIVVGGHGVFIQQDRILAWGTVEARATLQSRVADARAHDLDAPVQLNGIRLQPHSRIDHVRRIGELLDHAPTTRPCEETSKLVLP